MALIARSAPVMLLLAACGPMVVPDQEGDGSSAGGSTGEGTSTGPQDPSATTSSGPLDDTSASDPDDTTAADESSESTGEPSDPCPSPVRGLTYLWCGPVSTRASAATDGSWVYFAAGDGDLMRVPAAGGDAEVLAASLGDLFDIAVADGVVYWTAFFDGAVGAVAASGGPLQILADDLFKPSSIAVGGGFAFVTQYEDDLAVMRYGLASGLATPLYPDQDYSGNAFVLGDALYFATGTNNGNDGSPLMRGSFDGAPLQEVIDAGGMFADIEPEDATLWWARYRVGNSAILRTVLEPPFDTTTIHSVDVQPLSLAITADRIYWTQMEITESSQEGRVSSVTREGDDLVVHFSSSAFADSVLATDAGVVFLLDSAVVRLD